MSTTEIEAALDGRGARVRVEGDAGKPAGYISLWLTEGPNQSELLLGADDAVRLIAEIARAVHESSPLHEYVSQDQEL